MKIRYSTIITLQIAFQIYQKMKILIVFHSEVPDAGNIVFCVNLKETQDLPQFRSIFHFNGTPVPNKPSIFIQKIDAFMGMGSKVLELIL